MKNTLKKKNISTNNSCHLEFPKVSNHQELENKIKVVMMIITIEVIFKSNFIPID
jgi:hypothetical protein